jgi:hypothetical protein
MMDPKQRCGAHEKMVADQTEMKGMIEDGSRRFELLGDKVDDIARDIRTIMEVLTGDLRGTSAGIQQRLTALEGIVKGINKAAWLIGIPILLAAIFGVINAAILVWRKVM